MSTGESYRPRGPYETVYLIHCTVNDWVYVGHTCDAPRRWNAHRAQLRRGVHCCHPLQADWKRYGEGCFRFCPVLRYYNLLPWGDPRHYRIDGQLDYAGANEEYRRIIAYRAEGRCYNIVLGGR